MNLHVHTFGFSAPSVGISSDCKAADEVVLGTSYEGTANVTVRVRTPLGTLALTLHPSIWEDIIRVVRPALAPAAPATATLPHLRLTPDDLDARDLR